MDNSVKVRFLDLQRNYEAVKDEIEDNIKNNVLDQATYINGPSVKKFEREFAEYIGVKHCVGVANGTDALEIALEAIGIVDGDEVITQNNTFVSTCLGIEANRGKTVLVDCDAKTCMMDIEQIEEKITPKTKAIIVVHLYGHVVDINKVLDLANRYKLYIIEDAAQAHGALYKGKQVGSFGDISCFSFYPGKNLGAYGDGGAIVTNNDRLAKKVGIISNLGSETKYYHTIKGRNSRLDSIQAEILSTKLKYLDGWNSCRRDIAKRYNRRLKGVGDIILLECPSYCTSVHHLFIIRTDFRDELRRCLNKEGIETGIHYPIPINRLDAFVEHRYESYPVSENNSKTMLSLPMFPEMTDGEIDLVVKSIKNFFSSIKDVDV